MSTNRIYVKIYAGNLIYDRLAINTTSLKHFHASEMIKTSSKVVNLYRLRLSGVTLHCLIKALTECQQCRDVVLNYLLNVNNIDRVRIHLMPLSNCEDTIDYNW